MCLFAFSLPLFFPPVSFPKWPWDLLGSFQTILIKWKWLQMLQLQQWIKYVWSYSLAQNSSFLPMWFNSFFPTLCVWNGAGLDSYICPGIAGWVLVSTGQNGVRGHHPLVPVYTWQCVHSHIFVFSDGHIHPMDMPENPTEMKSREQRASNLQQVMSYERSTGQPLNKSDLISSGMSWQWLWTEMLQVCGWPDPGPFASTALPMTASENMWQNAVPRPSGQEFNKVTGCLLGKGATWPSPLSHSLEPSPRWCDRSHRMCFSEAIMQLVLI